MSSPQQVRDITLESLLLQKKSAIVRKWFDAILETYPADTAKFLKSQKNQFANPVGAMISEGIEGLFEELLNGVDPEKVSPFLDKVIRIRAVQDLTPTQAVAFVFVLKRLIREELGSDIQKHQLSGELLSIESRIDGLALLSFDIYMKCREQVYEIRATEWKNRLFRLLQKTNMIGEIPEEQPDPKDTNIDSLNEVR
ncbi:MAG: RsbRD N-terminal domain-containing protein [Desulfovibrionales bacterium]|nr:RsbRD N-terminal domain-containing protein [Desulfovibrionales bacterium]